MADSPVVPGGILGAGDAGSARSSGTPDGLNASGRLGGEQPSTLVAESGESTDRPTTRFPGGVGDSPVLSSEPLHVGRRGGEWEDAGRGLPKAADMAQVEPLIRESTHVGQPPDSPVRGTLVADGVRESVLGLPGEPAVLVPALPGSAAGPVGTSGAADRGLVSKALSRDLAVVQKADDRIRRRAERIVAAALRAPELPEDGSAPAGWSKRDVRVARDATSTLKTAPAYLGMAQRVLESYRKLDAAKEPSPPLNAIQIVVNNPTFSYPVVKVER